MYAIIEIGGNQYKVAPGNYVVVDKIPADPGQELTFKPLLVVDRERTELGQVAKDTSVLAKVIKHFSGKKIDVFRFRAKSRYRRHIGFRSNLTQIHIESIGAVKPEVKKKSPIIKPRLTSSKKPVLRLRKTKPKLSSV